MTATAGDTVEKHGCGNENNSGSKLGNGNYRWRVGSILVIAPRDPVVNPGGVKMCSALYLDVQGSLISREARTSIYLNE